MTVMVVSKLVAVGARVVLCCLTLTYHRLYLSVTDHCATLATLRDVHGNLYRGTFLKLTASHIGILIAMQRFLDHILLNLAL